MFERFTERARQVVAYAQEAARELQHPYIGTEHILLGLIDEGEGLAGALLEQLGVKRGDVTDEVVKITGGPATTWADEWRSKQIPFTPRGQKVCELALREALSLGHNYIGTEHILLGIVREGEGVGMRVLLNLDVDSEKIRNEVIRALSGQDARRQATPKPGGPLPLHSLLGERVRGQAHGGTPFEGELVAIADKPQALIRDDGGKVHHFTIDTIRNLDVERREWVSTGR